MHWEFPWGVQWLRLHASYAEGAGSILSQGTKIPYGTRQKKKKIAFIEIEFLGHKYQELTLATELKKLSSTAVRELTEPWAGQEKQCGG